MGRYFYLAPVLEGGPEERHPVSASPQLVGRSEHAGIVLRDPTVSRQHARIEVKDDQVFLEDLGSKHGTFVNSRRVQSVRIKPGDLIVFGLAVVLRLEETDEPLVAPGFDDPEPTSFVTEDPSLMTLSRRDLLDKLPMSPVDASGVEDLALSDHALKLTRLGGLCMELLPGLYSRLTQLSDRVDQEPVDLRAARATVEALLSTATQLMEVAARIAPQPRTLVRLAEMVERAAKRVEQDFLHRQIEVAIRVPSELEVRGDAEQMEAVIAGLLTNAGNQSLDGALVEVVGRPDPAGVVLKILDQGYGYPEEVLTQAFHPLGAELADPAAIRLWEARRAVVALGGTLTVRSNEGVGATVRIVLPVAEHGRR